MCVCVCVLYTHTNIQFYLVFHKYETSSELPVQPVTNVYHLFFFIVFSVAAE